MAQQVQVSCIRRDTGQDPDRRIDAIGGDNANGRRWWLPLPQAIAHIEAGDYQFFTMVNNRFALVIIATYNGRKYLKTEADGLHPNNLLSLPECT